MLPVRHNPEPLLQIVDQAFASSAARSGAWLVCHPGCSQCCHGVFAISPLDAHRLRQGLSDLNQTDAARANRIRARVAEAVPRLSPGYPGNAATGALFTEPHHEDAFDGFANEEPCPVLDPLTQTCDLYAARPMLCRTFGPPLAAPGGGLALCELCFQGAPPEEIERCQLDPVLLTAEADAEQRYATRPEAPPEPEPHTIVAFALRNS